MAKKKTFRKKQSRRVRKKPAPPPVDKIVHPLRACPYGQHQVVEHAKRNSPSKSHPEGSISTVRWHCANNPSGKDQLYPDEIREIAAEHFFGLKNMPCALPLGFPNGSKFDDLIAGWTQYWNDVLKPETLLEPNLVKALIASESGFRPAILNKKKDPNSARGLMQITNETRKLLNDDAELEDHFLTVSREDLNDPSVNICAGIRWLFRKREIASVVRLKRQATWLEAAEEFKGDLADLQKGIKKTQIDVAPFLKYLEAVVKCGQ